MTKQLYGVILRSSLILVTAILLVPRPVIAQTIEVTPITSGDFGAVGLDVTASQPGWFTIKNIDPSIDLTINNITSSNAEFAIIQPSPPVTLTPGTSVVLVVRFTPTGSAGSRSDTITIDSTDPINSPSIVPVTGYGGIEQSITLTPENIEVEAAQGLAFQAIVAFGNGSTGIAQLNWASSNTSVAQVSPGSPDLSTQTPTGDAFTLVGGSGTATITVSGVHNTGVIASTSISVVPPSPHVFVATAATDRVYKVNAGISTLLHDFPETDTFGDPLYDVSEIGADPNGNFYVAAGNSNNFVDEVFYFDTALTRSRVFNNTNANLFSVDMVVDSIGDAILSNGGTNELWQVTPSGSTQGTLLTSIGLPDAGEMFIDSLDNIDIGSFVQTATNQNPTVYQRNTAGNATALAALFNTFSTSSSNVLGIARTAGNRLFVSKKSLTGHAEVEEFTDINGDSDFFEIVGNDILADAGEIQLAGAPGGSNADLEIDCNGNLIVPISEPEGIRVERWIDGNTNGNFNDPFERRVLFQGAASLILRDISFDCTPTPNPPVADNRSASTAQNQSVTVVLTATDADGDCPLTFSTVGAPFFGGTLGAIFNPQCTAGVASALVTFTPFLDFIGTDIFAYKANDGTNDSALANVTVNVLDPAPTISTIFPVELTGLINDAITIFGTNLCVNECNSNASTETQVAVGNGTFYTPDFVAPTFIQVHVETFNATGPITVQAPGGTVVSTQIYVIPDIAGISPLFGSVGTIVGTFGTNLCQGDCAQTQVGINGVMTAPLFASDTNVVFTVPVGATTGPLTLTGTTGTLTGIQNFTVN